MKQDSSSTAAFGTKKEISNNIKVHLRETAFDDMRCMKSPWILGSHGDDYEEYYLLGYAAVLSCSKFTDVLQEANCSLIVWFTLSTLRTGAAAPECR
jgi:hypothetical protein